MIILVLSRDWRLACLAQVAEEEEEEEESLFKADAVN
jgi:hypothetical protein